MEGRSATRTNKNLFKSVAVERDSQIWNINSEDSLGKSSFSGRPTLNCIRDLDQGAMVSCIKV